MWLLLFKLLLLTECVVPVFATLVAAELRILPAVNPHVHDMTAGSSEPVTLSCAAPDLTTTEAGLKWLNNQDEEITATSGGRFISDFGRTLVLRIPNPTEDDAGTYTCRGVVNGVAKKGSITLELYRGMNMTSPLTQYATQGSDAKIWCRFTKTNLEKDISWYQEEWTLIRSDDKYRVEYEDGAGQEGDYLEIKDIQLDDGGKYICNIDLMSIGKTKAYPIQVVVTVPPKMIIPITFNPVVPKEGDRLVMSCEASGTPRPTYMFKKNNQDLLEQPITDGNYIIEKVSRTDEGLYQCAATNKGGSDRSDVTLDVKIHPVIETPDDHTWKTEKENREVRLQCRATGDPAPALTWQKTGSEVIYSVGPNGDVYVEEQEGSSEQDAQTRVYSKTLYLVIPTLKPKHAGEYVCTASTTAVTVDKTFKIDVMFRPNFDNQATTRFWGWVGSKTNLTCIANGNPEPVIEWHKEGQNLASTNDYVIIDGNSGLPTRSISYLIPTVANGNVRSVFGSYSCKALNKFGENREELTFEQARVPREVGITVQDTRATKLGLAITPPAEDGGQAVTQYLIKYNKLNNGEEEKSRTIDRVAGEAMTKVDLVELDPNTQYSIKVYAINNVGSGAERNAMGRTADYSEPDRVMVKSPRMGANAYEYTLSWDVPFTGGANIAKYIVEYAEAPEVNNTNTWTAVRVLPQAQTENIPGQASTSVVLDNLKKNTFYQAKIKAVNRIGTSDETTFIFRTGSGVKPNFDNQATTRFWGWVDSKTNLTCIANGNPEPVIEWHKEGQNLAFIDGYLITNGNSGLPTRSISYLIPTVDYGNVGSVFGSYSCKASNKFGGDTEQLTFEQARVPGEVGITVQDTRATKLGLAITFPAEDGGQAVTQYLLKYNKLNNGEEEKSRTIDRVAGEAMTKVELEELDPNTQYSIKVYAINNVGSGAGKNFMERTADYMGPSGEAGGVRAGVAGMVLVVMVTACLQLFC